MDSALPPLPRGQTWSSSKIALRPGADGIGVFAIEAISAGETLLALAHVFVEHAERHTIQLDVHLHQAGTGEIDDFLNHACTPNAVLDFEHLELRAARPIAAGEELNFNYLTSEWDMAAPFACVCGAAGCHRNIQGFRHLNPEQQELLAPLVSPYLRRRLAELRALRGAAG
jgi:hypothetical protein